MCHYTIAILHALVTLFLQGIVLSYHIYIISKLILFTNSKNSFVHLFTMSLLFIGQLLSVCCILLCRVALSWSSRVHSQMRWSAVCGPILQGHVGSSMILKRWKYVLTFPCPVMIVVSLVDLGIFFLNLSLTLGKNVFVSAPFVEASHSSCHTCMPFSLKSLMTLLFGGLSNEISVCVQSVASFARWSANSFPNVPACA